MLPIKDPPPAPPRQVLLSRVASMGGGARTVRGEVEGLVSALRADVGPPLLRLRQTFAYSATLEEVRPDPNGWGRWRWNNNKIVPY